MAIKQINQTITPESWHEGNKISDAIFTFIEQRLDEKMREQEKESLFKLNWKLKQAHLMGYRLALRELLYLRPDRG